MSSFELTGPTPCRGQPVARKVVDACGRAQVIVTGTISATRTLTRGTSPVFCCTFDDGTGQLDLLFLGRRTVPGFTAGASCTVQGTVLAEGDRLVIWNPLYHLDPPASGDAAESR